ncbi:MAG: hypothetical protein R2810_16790 [Flavobacteriales bacterium]
MPQLFGDGGGGAHVQEHEHPKLGARLVLPPQQVVDAAAASC